ncbi:hypothetical protein LWI29_029646 [Acer saccharum]|uniref:Uncharacterized protein n=1 Tax=Acer saccharum TaxID=4024 RepID=A0AA39TT00_ACESA|nr:hypothetical protein LWI29_029646 [Acer saccharum]
MPKGDALRKLEERGVVIRFVIGRSANRGDSLDRNIDEENRTTKDFLILEGHEEAHEEWPKKTILTYTSNYPPQPHQQSNEGVKGGLLSLLSIPGVNKLKEKWSEYRRSKKISRLVSLFISQIGERVAVAAGNHITILLKEDDYQKPFGTFTNSQLEIVDELRHDDSSLEVWYPSPGVDPLNRMIYCSWVI